MKKKILALTLFLFIGCSEDKKTLDNSVKMTTSPTNIILDTPDMKPNTSNIKGGTAPYTIVYPKNSLQGGVNNESLVLFNTSDVEIKIENNIISLNVKNDDLKILYTPFLIRDSKGKKAIFVAEPTVFDVEHNPLSRFEKYLDDPQYWQNY